MLQGNVHVVPTQKRTEGAVARCANLCKKQKLWLVMGRVTVN